MLSGSSNIVPLTNMGISESIYIIKWENGSAYNKKPKCHLWDLGADTVFAFCHSSACNCQEMQKLLCIGSGGSNPFLWVSAKLLGNMQAGSTLSLSLCVYSILIPDHIPPLAIEPSQVQLFSSAGSRDPIHICRKFTQTRKWLWFMNRVSLAVQEPGLLLAPPQGSTWTCHPVRKCSNTPALE